MSNNKNKTVRKKNNQCKRKRPKMKGGAEGNYGQAVAVLVKIIAGCIGVIVMYGIFFHCDEWKFPHDLCHAVQEIKDTLSPWLLLVPFYPAIANSVKSFFGEKAAAEGAAEGGGKAAAEGAAAEGAEGAAAAAKEAAAQKLAEELGEQAAHLRP
jgi:hypothetical protein